MIERRYKVSSSALEGSDFTPEVALPFEEIANELDRSSVAIKQMLNWRLEKREIIFTPKPEAFGVVRIGSSLIEIYPKFAIQPESINHSFLTNLFQLSNKTFIGKPQANSELQGEVGLFDLYFYIILSDLRAFLRRYNRVVLKTQDEEVIGVRGRLKTMDSIRKSGGLKHKNICEVQTVEPRYEFLGLIKGFAKLIGGFCANPGVKQMSQGVCNILKEVKLLPFDAGQIRQLRSMARTLISEHRETKGVVQTMLGIFSLLEAGVGEINHSCFSFNMNYHFEILATKVIEKYAEQKNKSLLSGNNRPLDLLENQVSGLLIINEDEETFDVGTIKIKPDCYLSSSSGEIEWVLDAKYKILDYDPKYKTFSGVQSKDVQQLLSYWLHFFEKTGKRPNLSLIYPEVNEAHPDDCLRVVGRIFLNDPTKTGSKIQISICMLDIEKSLREVLESEDGINLATQVEKLAS